MKKDQKIESIYSLTPMQEGMLFYSILDEKSTAYSQNMVFTIRGTLDIEVLQSSYDKLFERYDILRTTFLYKNLKTPKQVVLKSRKSKIKFNDISMLAEKEKNEYVEQYIEVEGYKAFNLSKDVLMRVSILKVNEYEFRVIWSHHHILMDGWCIGIVLGDFFKIYEDMKNNKMSQLPMVQPYLNYIKWLQKQNKEEACDYWKDYVGGYENEIIIPGKLNDFSNKDYKQKSIKVPLGYNLTNRMESLSKKYGVTINTILQTIWAILLQRYNNTNDVIFGSVVSGRNPEVAGIENMVGLFINTIPVRVNTREDIKFNDLIKDIQNKAISSSKYDYYPLPEIQAKSIVKQNLINNIMVFENYPINGNMLSGESDYNIGFKIEDICVREKTNYDFNLVVAPSEDGLILDFDFNENIYDSRYVERIGEHFKNALYEALGNEEICIGKINILSEDEKNKVIFEFNNTQSSYESNKTIQELFEIQVDKTPNDLAVVFENEKLTYKELNDKINRLAMRLRQEGVIQDSIVAIMTERSIEMIIGIMAVLKSGGAYLPIDINCPDERIKYMMEDSKSKILLSHKKISGQMEFSRNIIYIEDVIDNSNDDKNPEIINLPQDLAYVIYTSGSTGKAKGVMIEHRNVVNLCHWYNNKYNVRNNKNTLQITNIAFDVAVLETIVVLINGGTIFIPTKEVTIDKIKFRNYVNKHCINSVQFVPATLNELIMDNDFMKSLSVLISGGDRLEDPLKSDVMAMGYNLFNHYGPTETTVDTIATHCNERNVIGKPVENTQVYIINEYEELQPIGVRGEICIGGDGVARGYLNRNELTSEKFIENKFSLNGRIYKTGDLGRWTLGGEIEFLGRIDNQVKIRGLRIELGEIENQLLRHNSIKEVAVIDKKDKYGNKYLCAYFVAKEELTIEEIRIYLTKNLPEYMIPSRFVILDKLPLNLNCKVDRNILRNMDEDKSISMGVEYEAPRDNLERELVRIWEEILKLNEVGINDNFFALGGHSLKVTDMVNKIYASLNIEIPIKEIFKSPTIYEISNYIRNMNKQLNNRIKKVDESEYYETSSAQKRMYLIQSLDKDSHAYNIPSIMDINGEVDNKKIEEVLNILVNRHEAFKTSFEVIEDKIVQRINKDININIEYVDNTVSGDEFIDNFIRPFDLSKAPLIRAGMLKKEKDKTVLVIDMHHIISDEVSMEIFNNEFIKLYNGEKLNNIDIQYKDYAKWQNEFLKSEEIKAQEKYWLNTFDDEIPVLNLQTDFVRPEKRSFRGDNISIIIDKETTKKLDIIAKQSRSTLYMVLLSSINILLSKYSGQEDIVVGSPISGRTQVGTNNIMGMFVNTLAMRNFPQGDKRYIEFLMDVKERALSAYDNQEYPFDMLIDKINISRDSKRNPLIDVVFALSNNENTDSSLNGLKINDYNYKNKVSKFDLTFLANYVDDEINFNIEYSKDVFKKSTINRMGEHLKNILNIISTNNSIKLKDIDMLSQEEKSIIIKYFNKNYVEYPKNNTIIELFEDRVIKTPHNIAAIYNDEKITYYELNRKANQLANDLRRKGIKPNDIVGIMIEPSLEMIIGIMGVIKSGAAYMPIDSKYPNERIMDMIEDSKTKILLTSLNLIDKIHFYGEKVCLDNEELYTGDYENLINVNKPEDLAYVIFTSGSTGRAKGIMVEHGNLVNLCDWYIKEFSINENDKISKYASFSFDASIIETFPPIISGACMHIISENIKFDLNALNKYFEQNNITVSFLPTAMCEEFMKLENKSLRLLAVGGDKLKSFIKRDYDLVDMYGPAECTVVTTFFKVEKLYNNSPIGSGVNNSTIYILNKDNKVQPIGVQGEIYVSGDLVTRGYLNNKQLTKERFLKDPFNLERNMYRTGDTGKWLEDGNIEFLGRIDQQVKIRGYRVELGEIENKLLSIGGVEDAVVLDKVDEKNIKYLNAYIVLNKKLTVKDITLCLRKSIPQYMIPRYFTEVEAIPLTRNGKVDKKTLINIEDKMTFEYEHVNVKNEIEEVLLNIFRTVVENNSIGVNDNFFEFGGNSLKCIELAQNIKKKINKNIEIQTIFENPTVEQLALILPAIDNGKYNSIDRINRMEYYDVTSTQKRMYVLNEMVHTGDMYNIPTAMIVDGEVNEDNFIKTINRLVDRHDSLRTRFEMINGEIKQIVEDKVKVDVKFIELEEHEVDSFVNSFIKPFDLMQAPLLRVALIKVSINKHIVVFDMHHIISDGISMQILNKEFIELYSGNELSPLRLQYKDFTKWQNNLINSEAIKKQEAYWLEQFTKETKLIKLPTDYERIGDNNFEGKTIEFGFDKDTTIIVDKFIKNANISKYMLFLSIFNIMMSKYSGSEDIVIGTPIAGRNHSDLNNIIGMFVNTLPLRNYPNSDKTFEEFLNEVKNNVLLALENQDYQYEQLLENIKHNNDLFNVMFALDKEQHMYNQIEGLKFMPYQIEGKTSKCDLTLGILDRIDKLSFNIEYLKGLFKTETIEAMGNHFINITKQVINDNKIKLSEIRMISIEEERKLLEEYRILTKNNMEKIDKKIKKEMKIEFDI